MKRRTLGQHYLVDPVAIRRITGLADVKPTDRILEIGTGKGALTKELAGLGASFLGYEVDRGNFESTLEAVRGTGAEIRLADAFEEGPKFDVLVASLPYSRSASFVEWLSAADFDRAVVVLQEDFVRKLLANPRDRNYRGISALAQVAFDIEVKERVGRGSFSPQPRVSSVVVAMKPRRRVGRQEAENIIRLFSIRRRQVESALRELGLQGGSYGKRRVYSLLPDEVHEICRARGSQ